MSIHLEWKPEPGDLVAVKLEDSYKTGILLYSNYDRDSDITKWTMVLASAMRINFLSSDNPRYLGNRIVNFTFDPDLLLEGFEEWSHQQFKLLTEDPYISCHYQDQNTFK